ncbi:adenosine kinase [Falsirhodobacter algicola]|uniref:Adenosine kinase n=1 Tax=Falsirhodobacter algicola TaxID=2692330 RepID=A0A8J8MTX0_9RHOB|nr:adenosine kinase [Falsirhodobacter algicola]QUS36620.1 adenosine kinase [Falsirhodobacter algicola]
MKTYQVVGIGNAMVDVLASASEEFLTEHGIGKGVMQLIDKGRAVDLYAHVGPSREISGGSAANTISGIAQLGGRTAYVGKVKDDQLGAIFAHDLRAQGATYETPMAGTSEQETGRCIVCVTSDGERSMSTYLGVSEFLGPDDIDEGMMAAAEWIYLEGYRFDGPASHEAFAKAIRACKSAGGKVSITLSDPFCVERHRDAFRRLLSEEADLLFANRAELLSMYQTDDFQAALTAAAADVAIVACTEGENGAHVLSDGQHWHIPAVPTQIADATGAGDLFAAGFLWGVTQGHDLEACGRMGCVAASEVISHIGARPEADLKALFAHHGLV